MSTDRLEPATEITPIGGVERQVEESAREIAQLKAALDHHAIVAITNTAGQITYVNDKFCAVSRYTRQELLGANHRIMNSGFHSKEYFGGLWQTIVAGQVFKGEFRNRAKDGTIFWVDTTIVPFFRGGPTPHEYVAISTDITQHKQATESLQKRTEELQRSNAALAEFAFVASHDLQEPLRGVSGCVQLLRSRYQGKLDQSADEFIAHSIENIERMQQLIFALLEYSRVGSKGRAFAAVDSNEAFRTALRNLDVAIRESRGTVTAENLPVIYADRAQITQLFQNLIGNSIKFRGDQPLSVHVWAQELPEGGWQFSIKDNGIGIAPRHAGRIFGVFQRLHSRSRFPGTGIGLAVCKRIVERHGGRIWVESEQACGALFHFTLPNEREVGVA